MTIHVSDRHLIDTEDFDVYLPPGNQQPVVRSREKLIPSTHILKGLDRFNAYTVTLYQVNLPIWCPVKYRCMNTLEYIGFIEPVQKVRC
jgi:hypothetical protein